MNQGDFYHIIFHNKNALRKVYDDSCYNPNAEFFGLDKPYPAILIAFDYSRNPTYYDFYIIGYDCMFHDSIRVYRSLVDEGKITLKGIYWRDAIK